MNIYIHAFSFPLIAWHFCTNTFISIYLNAKQELLHYWVCNWTMMTTNYHYLAESIYTNVSKHLWWETHTPATHLNCFFPDSDKVVKLCKPYNVVTYLVFQPVCRQKEILLSYFYSKVHVSTKCYIDMTLLLAITEYCTILRCWTPEYN